MEPVRLLVPFRALAAVKLKVRHCWRNFYPLMQSASPSEFIRIAGSASSVQHSPHALSRYTVLQGLPDNSLRSGWDIRTSPLLNFRSASEFYSKAAGSRTTLPLLANLVRFFPDRRFNRSRTNDQDFHSPENQTLAGSPELSSCLIKTEILPFTTLSNRS
jgi:hypothetical protein